MISFELEELAARVRGMSEGELLHDEGLQGLSDEEFGELCGHLRNAVAPLVRARLVARLVDEERALRLVDVDERHEDRMSRMEREGERMDREIREREALTDSWRSEVLAALAEICDAVKRPA